MYPKLIVQLVLGHFFLLCSVGLVSCAPTPNSPPSAARDAEMKTAVDARDSCFAREATALDDGISDRSTIGQAVYRAYYSQVSALFGVATRGNEHAAADVAPEYVRRMQEQATSWVLSYRQYRRNRTKR
jgi:hypothetical protein